MSRIVFGLLGIAVVSAFYWLLFGGEPVSPTSLISSYEGLESDTVQEPERSGQGLGVGRQSFKIEAVDSEQAVSGMPLLPGLEIFLGGAVADTRRRVEHEPVDPAWSPTMEAQLAEYLRQIADETGGDVSNVYCSSRTCEVQMVAYGVSDRDTQGWLTLLNSRLYERHWAAELFTSGLASGEVDGGDAVIWFLSRR